MKSRTPLGPRRERDGVGKPWSAGGESPSLHGAQRRKVGETRRPPQASGARGLETGRAAPFLLAIVIVTRQGEDPLWASGAKRVEHGPEASPSLPPPNQPLHLPMHHCRKRLIPIFPPLCHCPRTSSKVKSKSPSELIPIDADEVVLDLVGGHLRRFLFVILTSQLHHVMEGQIGVFNDPCEGDGTEKGDRVVGASWRRLLL